MKRIHKAVMAISMIGGVILVAVFLGYWTTVRVAETPKPAVAQEQVTVTPQQPEVAPAQGDASSEQEDVLPEEPAEPQPALEAKLYQYTGRWFAEDYKVEFNQSGDPVPVGTFIEITIDQYTHKKSILITSSSPQPTLQVARVKVSLHLDDETSGSFKIGNDGWGHEGEGRVFFQDGQITIVIQLNNAGTGEWGLFNGTKAFNKNGPQPFTFSDLQLGKLEIGMFYNQVMQVMPQPVKEEGDGKDIYWDMLFADGTEVVLMAGRVHRLSVETDEYPTPRGVKVGDTKEKVVEAYGPPADISWDGNEELWDYEDRMTIFFKDGKVDGFFVWIRFN